MKVFASTVTILYYDVPFRVFVLFFDFFCDVARWAIIHHWN
jgi:hypothetical protein